MKMTRLNRKEKQKYKKLCEFVEKGLENLENSERSDETKDAAIISMKQSDMWPTTKHEYVIEKRYFDSGNISYGVGILYQIDGVDQLITVSQYLNKIVGDGPDYPYIVWSRDDLTAQISRDLLILLSYENF